MLGICLVVVSVVAADGMAPLAPEAFEEAFPQEAVTFFGQEAGLPGGGIATVHVQKDGQPAVLTVEGWYVLDGERWNQRDIGLSEKRSIPGRHLGGSPVLAAAVANEVTYVATEEHLSRYSPAKRGEKAWEDLQAVEGERRWDTGGVRALAFDGKALWAGFGEGVGRFEDGKWKLYTGEEGLPYAHFTCAASGQPGVVWFGTERGAIRFDGEHWFYRAGRRWLPDDHVNGIAVAADGTAWIATPKGVVRIVPRQQTLEEKAAEFERIIEARHRRLGQFVLRCYFPEPGNLEKSTQRATDNDGLYTAMYGAAESFRYAVTKDPAAKESAVRTFKACKLLFDVTGIPGFPARSVIPTDGSDPDPNITYTEASNLAQMKDDPLWKNILPRWPKSADGKYWWKCDTSSDETCGHYFFYAVYHDLVCETDAERREVADVVHAMTKHIVDHNFTLTDHDGKPTRWANWSPEYVNGRNGWMDQGLQSIEILSYLNIGLRLTGDQKFAEAAKYLRDKHHYHINAIRGRCMWPPESVVPWDNNLAFLSFYGLIAYEQDPVLRQHYRFALDNTWLFSARQNDPFFNIVYLALYPQEGEDVSAEAKAERERALAKSVETLVRTPQLLINWRAENSHRLDVYNDPTPRRGKAYGWLRTGDAVPIEERSHIRINSDHFDLDTGGGGDCEYEGTFFLLPYYMGRYFELIRN